MVRSSLLLAVVLSNGCASGPRRVESPRRPATFTWETWRPEAFERARAQRRLLLINVAAGWCHWCHVMDAETYADREVAALLADHFVPIRVDADARPDLAERYQRWGWPATAVLTPDAQPVLERRGYQAPRTFVALLGRLVADLDAGRPIARIPEPPTRPAGPADLERAVPVLRAFLDGQWDDEQTGWGKPQKVPWPAPIEEAFLRSHLEGEPRLRDRALATLDNEARIVDPVWGGMYQYSVRGVWTMPHFEKIVPVQAGAIEGFSTAFRVSGEQRWLDLARRIHRYVREFLTAPEGGFYASQDADLGHETDGHAYYALDDAGRRRLGIPRVDRSVYADLNGRMIEALCTLHQATLDDAVLADALRAAERIERTHRTAPGAYAHDADDRGGLVHLADEVAMGRSFLSLFEETGEARWRSAASGVAAFLLERLEDRDGGGFFAHTEDPHAVGVFAERRKPFETNALAARFLLHLHLLTDEARLRDAALRALSAMAPETRRNGVLVAEHLIALEELFAHRVHFTVIGPQDDAPTMALYRQALRFWDPRRVLERSDPGAKYPDIGHPAAYLCDDTSCSNPIVRPEDFAAKAREFLAR